MNNLLLDFNDIEKDVVISGAKQMALAARTAPKARGIDSIHIKIIMDEDLKKLGEESIKLGENWDMFFFERDGKLIQKTHALLLIGVENTPLGLAHCGFCGFNSCSNCANNKANCSLKLADLGIAVGSAVSIANDLRLDTRVLYTAGKAALSLNLFENENITNAYGIGISAKGKNIFFDRQ